MCSVSFQPSRPSFAAAARATSSTSGGMPESHAGSVTTRPKSLVASSTLSWKRDESAASSSWSCLKRALPASGSSAPPEAEVAQLVLDQAALRGTELRRTPGEAASALNRPYRRRSWPCSVENCVTFGSAAL